MAGARPLAALLRAVNVGGRKVVMAELRRVAADLGLEAPTTLLASGNLLFRSDLGAETVARRLEAAIAGELGVATDVLVRDRAGLAEAVQANPFRDQAAAAPSRLMAMFLAGAPQDDLAALASACTLGEQVQAGPECLYLWYPHGAGASKLSNAVIERRLKVRGTARNWNTVAKLSQALA